MNTENGANVGGDIDTGGGNFIGRDQFIQNIIVVGQFLDYAGIKKIISEPSVESVDFSKISDELIKAIKEQIPSDLATSLAFTGEIIKDFLQVRWKDKPFAIVGTRQAMGDLAQIIGKHLTDSNYWGEYSISIRGFEGERYLPEQAHSALGLPLTSKLFTDTFPDNRHLFNFYLVEVFTVLGSLTSKINFSKTYDFAFIDRVEQLNKPIQKMEYTEVRRIMSVPLSNAQFRVVMAGVVLDLIRLQSLSSSDSQFWDAITKLLGIRNSSG